MVADELEPGTAKYKTISAKLKHHAVLYPSLLFFLSFISPLIKILDKSEGYQLGIWRDEGLKPWSNLVCAASLDIPAQLINYDALLASDPTLVSNNGQNCLNNGFIQRGTYQKNFVLWLKRVKQVDNKWTFWDCECIPLCNNCRKRQYQVIAQII